MANLSNLKNLASTVKALPSFGMPSVGVSEAYFEDIKQMATVADPINEDIFKMAIDNWGTSPKKVDE